MLLFKLQNIHDKEQLKTYKQILNYMDNREIRNNLKIQNRKRMDLE